MPIYEYECKSCGVHFDRKQHWHDEPVKHCPDCQGEVRKVIQPVGIVFKGPGFYKTDNSSSGERQARKRDEEGKASGGDTAAKVSAGQDSQAGAKDDSKTDTQSETKSESQADSKTGAKSESKPESRSEPRPESRADSKSQSKPEPKAESKAGTNSESRGHSRSSESSQDR